MSYWDQPPRVSPRGYMIRRPLSDKELELHRKANANLKDPNRTKKVPSQRELNKALRPPNADEIASGHMVLELRELVKLERRISKAADRDFKGSDFNQGMWEEVDHRIETLQGALQAHSKAELTRFVRAYNKSLAKA